MKKIFLLLSLFSLTTYASDEKTVSSSISEVTVYQQGAQIERRANYSVSKGITTITIEGVSPNIDPNSLQVRASGEVIILDSKYTVFYPEPEPVQQTDNSIPLKIRKEILALQDSIFDQDYKINEVQYQIDVLNNEKRIIENNGTIKGEGKVNDSIPLLKDALEFYHAKMNDINKQLLQLNRKKFILQKERNRMNGRLTELQNYNVNNNYVQPKNNAPIHQIKVTVSADATASGRLKINYLVRNAGWVPSYDFRSEANSSSVDLTYKAQVYQNTGIDWEGVRLNLSTNNPYTNKTKPTLSPWYLDYYTYQNTNYYNGGGNSPQSTYNAAPSFEKKERSDAYADLAEEEFSEATLKDYTQMVEHLLSVEYKIDLPYDIKSDGQMNMVLVDSKSLKTEYKYFAIPKLDLSVYLVARITNLGELNLVPGKANLFHDGAYLGETYLNPSVMEDTMDLSLGKDPNILIKRTLLKNDSKEKVVGEKIVKTYAYLIEIKNHKSKNIDLIIQDQIPVTRNKEIEIEVTDLSKGKLNEITGIINWDEKIKSTGDKEIKIAYQVKYDKTQNINLAAY